MNVISFTAHSPGADDEVSETKDSVNSRGKAQNTTQKSISIVFCVSVIRHDSSLSKYRKQKQSPPWTCAIFSISRGGTASVYGTC